MDTGIDDLADIPADSKFSTDLAPCWRRPGRSMSDVYFKQTFEFDNAPIESLFCEDDVDEIS